VGNVSSLLPQFIFLEKWLLEQARHIFGHSHHYPSIFLAHHYYSGCSSFALLCSLTLYLPRRSATPPFFKCLALIMDKSSRVPSRGTRSARGARGSARGRGSKSSSSGRIIWHHVQDSKATDDTAQTTKANYLSNVYTVSESGSFSSRTAYVAAEASPKKRRILTNTEWNQTPASEPLEVNDFPWMDPDYDEFMLQVTVEPPKRKRAPGVWF
jgi:hypothetical protein